MSIVKKRILVLAVIILLGVFGFVGHSVLTQKVPVRLVYSTPDVFGVSVKFNGNSLEPSSKNGPKEYKLSPGNYALTISKPGFSNFSVHFDAQIGEPISVNVKLRLSTDSTIHNISEVSLPGDVSPDIQITKAQYFYDKTWAVLTIQAIGTDVGYAVVAYDPPSATWHTALGPGTLFNPGTIKGLPSLVQGYLNANNLVNIGSAASNE